MEAGKRLADLLAGVEVLQWSGDPQTRIRGIAYDSREVEPGCLFAALPGVHTDGHRFIPEAVRRGAAAVLHSLPCAADCARSSADGTAPAAEPGGLTGGVAGAALVQVADTRRALSPVAAAFHDHPSRRLTVFGVTGTDGKSTTVWLIHQLLRALGRPSGFISTVQVSTGGEAGRNPLRQSTPEATEIHRLLREMLDAGCSHAVVEATSHGLSARTNRLGDVAFDVAVLTNVTHDHLEFHGTPEQYRSDKANLFRSLSTGVKKNGGRRFGVVNLEDPHHAWFRAQTDAPVLSYGVGKPEADLWAEELNADAGGTTLRLRTRLEAEQVRLNLPGPFNVENLLAAALAVTRLLGVPLASVAPHVAGLKPVRGRMEPVDLGQPFRVVVDYAHTPAAFRRVFPVFRRATPGSLVAVFGSAGERDLEKRPQLGAVASEYCDRIILADEDPRGEDGLAILRQVAAGCRSAAGRTPEAGGGLRIIADRRQAIRAALAGARAGDTVVLLGKGHESSILYARGPIGWDEAEEARAALRELGFGR